MANMFTEDISDIRQLLQDVDTDLIHLRKNLSDQFGDAAKCMKVCYKVSDHIDESSKLESRIKRLERLLK